MPRSPLDAPTTAQLALRLSAPVAGVLAMVSLAAFQVDRVAAAETAYLALAAGAVLAAAAGLAPRSGATSAVGTALAVAAVWLLPAGPGRGAVALTVAAGTLAVAAMAAAASLGRRGPEASRAFLASGPAVAMAVGLQALLRGGELLGSASILRTAIVFVAFPVVGAAAVLALARLQGRRRALLVAAAVLALGPGLRPATLTALVALVAGPVALGRGSGRGGDRAEAWLRRPAARLAALALLAAPFAWDPRAAAAAAAAGLALGLAPGPEHGEEPDPRRPAGLLAARVLGGSWAPAAVGAAALALAAVAPGGSPSPGFLPSWSQSLELAALVPLAVPSLALAGGRRWGIALASLALALAAGRAVAVEGALAAPGALAACALPERRELRRPAWAAQAAWSGSLLALAALLGAYPWLRTDPLVAVFERLRVPVTWWGALVVMSGGALLVALVDLVRERARDRVRARGGPSEPPLWSGGPAPTIVTTVALVFALLIAGLPVAGSPLLGDEALVLDRAHPEWTGTLPRAARARGGLGATVVLDSALANAAGLPRGTPVATVRLRSPRGPERVWTLRLGVETGEWAAGRPDLAPARAASPEPWLSWVAADGVFFGRRYRAVHRLEVPPEASRLEVTLRPDLPPEVALTLFHLEVRP
jgi:hypothetical protein